MQCKMTDKQKALSAVNAMKWGDKLKVGDEMWLNRLPAKRHRIHCNEKFIKAFHTRLTGWGVEITDIDFSRRTHPIRVTDAGMYPDVEADVWCEPSDLGEGIG